MGMTCHGICQSHFYFLNLTKNNSMTDGYLKMLQQFSRKHFKKLTSHGVLHNVWSADLSYFFQ